MTEPVARIRIELLYFEPKIWRRAHVPLSSSLMMLHRIIQVVFGWTNSHLFKFRVGDRIHGRPHPLTGTASASRSTMPSTFG